MPFAAERSISLSNKDLLSWIFDEPKYDPDKAIYIDTVTPSRSISLRQARVIIRKLVAGLRAAGLAHGDCVCVHSFNDIYYPMLFLGIIAAGGVFAGTNPSYTPAELVHHIKTSRTTFLITEPEMLDSILAATKECRIPNASIWIFDVQNQLLPDGFRSWRELMNCGEQDWVRFDDLNTSRETTAARLYSSGTTGLPKAAMLSHYNLVAQHTSVFEFVERGYDISRILCLPMFHAATAPASHVSALRGGQVSYVMRRFELEPFLQNAQRYDVSDLVLVPPLVIAMIMSPVSRKYSLKSLKFVAIGAAPLSKEAQQKLLDDLLPPDTRCTQVWGMTETSCIATQFHFPENDNTGSVGRPIPNLDVKLVDEAGKDITAYDVPGEMCVRGPTVFKGYFNNPSANAESFDAEGYFRTGDIMYCESKTKKWYIIDRKKELIKVRGFQVAPPEIEAVLLTHPQIVDAAVIGVSMRLPGAHSLESIHASTEYPRAYVVRRPGPEGAKLTAEEVKEYTGKRLAGYKRLVGGVVFVDAIPKNASGKILKRFLREKAKVELGLERAKM